MKLSRIRFLLYKEYLQILRDKSVLAVAFILPVIMFVIYGFGMNMDIKPVRLTAVVHEADPETLQIRSLLEGSSYFEVTLVPSVQEGQQRLRAHEADALVQLGQRDGSGSRELYVAVNASLSQQAQLTDMYLQQALAPVLQGSAGSSAVSSRAVASAGAAGINLSARSWFNAENKSVFFLLPGQMAGIATLICSVMSSLVIAREFNRGTVESLSASRVTPGELLVAKLLPYYGLSMAGTLLLLVLAQLCFALPINGSLLWLAASFLSYNLVCCFIGLLISALVKDQFLATEYAVIVSFLPALLLSGAIFDLRSVPEAIYWLSRFLPSTYAVESVKICYMSGGNEDVLWRNLGFELLFALGLGILLYRQLASFTGHRRS